MPPECATLDATPAVRPTAALTARAGGPPKSGRARCRSTSWTAANASTAAPIARLSQSSESSESTQIPSTTPPRTVGSRTRSCRPSHWRQYSLSVSGSERFRSGASSATATGTGRTRPSAGVRTRPMPPPIDALRKPTPSAATAAAARSRGNDGSLRAPCPRGRRGGRAPAGARRGRSPRGSDDSVGAGAPGGPIVRLLLVAALLAGAGPAAAQGAAPADPGGHLARAREAFRTGGMLAALEAARAAVEAQPASVPALLAFGGMAGVLGEFDAARGAYAKAAALEPANLDVLYRSASLAVRVGEYDRALGLLDRIVAAHAWWARGLFRWGPRSVQIGLTRAYPALAWLAGAAPRTLRDGVLRSHPVLEHIVQLDIDILMEKGDLDRARRLARGYGVVEAGRDYCHEGRTRGRDWTPERVHRTFRLAALAQPEQADCLWWYGQWLTDEGYMRMGRLLVLEGTRLTPSAGNKASGENYLRVRHSGGLEVGKRAEQLALIARQRLARDRDPEGAARLLEEAIALEPGCPRP